MSNNRFLLMLGEFQDFWQLFQGIIQKKVVSHCLTVPLVIFDQVVPFFQKQCYFKVFLGKTTPKVSFLKIMYAALKFKITISIPSIKVLYLLKELYLLKN